MVTFGNLFEAGIRSWFADRLEIDKAFKEDHSHENRWDYLLGLASSKHVIALEPHSAEQDEISRVIRKREAALKQLRGHLRDAVGVSKWRWVASGKVHFANTEKARLRLEQDGIEFVGTKVLAEHLPPTTSVRAGKVGHESGGAPPRRRPG